MIGEEEIGGGGGGRCTFVCCVWTEEPTHQSLDSGTLVVM